MFTTRQFLNTPFGFAVVIQEETFHHYLQFMDGNGKIHIYKPAQPHCVHVTEIPWIIGHIGDCDPYPWITRWAHCKCWAPTINFSSHRPKPVGYFSSLNEVLSLVDKALVCNLAKSTDAIWLWENNILRPVILSDHLLHAAQMPLHTAQFPLIHDAKLD